MAVLCVVTGQTLAENAKLYPSLPKDQVSHFPVVLFLVVRVRANLCFMLAANN